MKAILAVGLLLCACASSSESRNRAKDMVLYSTPGAPKPEGKMICAVEYPTGSNIGRRVCRYEDHNNYNAQQAQDAIRELQHRGCQDPKCFGKN